LKAGFASKAIALREHHVSSNAHEEAAQGGSRLAIGRSQRAGVTRSGIDAAWGCFVVSGPETDVEID
jgi:hypothetical protein